MLASLKEVSDKVETLNCNPHNLPKATDEPSNCSVGIFSFFAPSIILSANFVCADFERMTNFEFVSEPSTCLLPRILFFYFMESFNAFSNIFLIISL